MKLSQIFTQLSIGELSQLDFGQGQGVINDKNQDVILNHINLGLNALYKRFNLKEGRITLSIIPGLYTYPLTSDHAESSKRTGTKYILDSREFPFRNDINKILSVFTEGGCPFPLNDNNEPYTIFTPTLNTIMLPRVLVDDQHKLPEWLRGNELTINYRAGMFPAICCPVGYVPEVVDVPLPDTYLEALLLFVASRIHNPIGMSQEFHQGNNYAAKYEAECARLQHLGLEVDHTIGNSRFKRNHWV